jgi:hypothetical protein
VSAKVLKGKVVTKARLPEGARLTLFVHEPDAAIELDHEDVSAITTAIMDIRAGRSASASDLRKFLRRK